MVSGGAHQLVRWVAWYDAATRQLFKALCFLAVLFPHVPCVPPGRSGSYIGSPELGLVNYFQAGVIRKPNAPLARDPWACR